MTDTLAAQEIIDKVACIRSWEELIRSTRERWAIPGKRMVLSLPEPQLNPCEVEFYVQLKALASIPEGKKYRVLTAKECQLKCGDFPWVLVVLIDDAALPSTYRAQLWLSLALSYQWLRGKSRVLIPIDARDWQRAYNGPLGLQIRNDLKRCPERVADGRRKNYTDVYSENTARIGADVIRSNPKLIGWDLHAAIRRAVVRKLGANKPGAKEEALRKAQ